MAWVGSKVDKDMFSSGVCQQKRESCYAPSSISGHYLVEVEAACSGIGLSPLQFEWPKRLQGPGHAKHAFEALEKGRKPPGKPDRDQGPGLKTKSTQ